VAGHPVGAGVPAWLATAAPEPAHAAALQVLLDAGAVVAGIAQTDELAFSVMGRNGTWGAPPNPAAPGHLPGGSTSGPAAAVAAGAADLGLGTDTAGSLRVPGSWCGLHALRPTHGAVPVAGVLPLAPSFDTVGLLARCPQLLRAAGDELLPALLDRYWVPGERLVVAV
ncbi:amidase family protein, partial [Kineococcus glutinatus]|uniref:amidase family protein n=1 Tax=Kineococcus glutinatus TaxID=1070872 RepID=UPI0031E7DE44